MARQKATARPPALDTVQAVAQTSDATAKLAKLWDEAVEAWRHAMKVAADEGDHKPARDWLLAAQKITGPQPTKDGGVTVNVGLALPGLPQGTPMKQIEGKRED